jgi:hypothetical protein
MSAMVIDPQAARVIAPRASMARRGVIVLAGPAFGGAAIGVWAFLVQPRNLITNRGFAIGAVLFLGGVVGFVWQRLWLSNVRLVIGQGHVGYCDILGRSRFWSSGEIARIVWLTIIYRKSSVPGRALYVFGHDGKRLLTLNPLAWETRDLIDYAKAIGVRLEIRETPVTAKEARREFPKAFGWGTEHIMAATILTMLAAVGLAVGGFVLLSSSLRR